MLGSGVSRTSDLNLSLLPPLLARDYQQGLIHTEVFRHLPSWAKPAFWLLSYPFCKNVPQGAATTVYAAAHPDLARHGGAYLNNCAPAKTSRPEAEDMDLARQLWDKTQEMIRKAGFPDV
jgi:retinol dehydrogenase 12